MQTQVERKEPNRRSLKQEDRITASKRQLVPTSTPEKVEKKVEKELQEEASKKKPKKTVNKKRVTVGTKSFLDPETGELTTFNLIDREDQDFDFHKIWMYKLVEALDLIGNKKIEVLTYLFDKKNSENIVIRSYREMAKDTGISLTTITDTMKLLQGADFVRMVKRGVWQLNPDMLFKGGHKTRMNVLLRYTKTGEAPDQNETGEEGQ